MQPGEFQVSFRKVLQNRQFLALWLAQFVSNFGDWLAILALISQVTFRWQGTPYQVSGLLFVFALPWALLGPVAGVFVDRWNAKATMIASDLIRAVLVVLLAVATELYQVYLLFFAVSAVSCFFLPAQTTVIPRLVPKEQLLVANALNAQTVQFNKIVSPALAGVLVGWAGEKICFYLDGASFVFSAGLLSLLAVGPAAQERKGGIRAVLEELHAGFNFLWTHAAIRFVTLVMVAAMLAIGAFDALAAVYVRDILRSRTEVFGLMVSLIGAGTIVGAVLIGKFAQNRPRVPLVALGILGLGVGVFVLAWAGATLVALLCSLYLGLVVSLVLIPSQTLVQEETPHEVLGRVSSTGIALITVAQLAAVALSGKMADLMGIRNVYFLVALVLVLVGLVGYGYSRMLRGAEVKVPVSGEG